MTSDHQDKALKFNPQDPHSERTDMLQEITGPHYKYPFEHTSDGL